MVHAIGNITYKKKKTILRRLVANYLILQSTYLNYIYILLMRGYNAWLFYLILVGPI